MSIVLAAWAYLTDPESWMGANGIIVERFNGKREFANDSIIALTIEHLAMTAAAVGIATAIALPLGLLLGHYGRGGTLTVVLTNVSRAIPTLALLMLFAASAIGFGNRAVVIAVAIFALPPILTNAYVGMRGVDEAVKDAARGTGMSRLQQVVLVEVPLAVPLIAAGMRTAITQSVATVPLAALVAGGGLGVIINLGIGTQRYGEVLAGGILVAVLSILVDALAALGQRAVTPANLRPAGTHARRERLA